MNLDCLEIGVPTIASHLKHTEPARSPIGNKMNGFETLENQLAAPVRSVLEVLPGRLVPAVFGGMMFIERCHACLNLYMVNGGLTLLQEFLAPIAQLVANRLDPGGLFESILFNLAGVSIPQLILRQFTYGMIRMSGDSFTEQFEHLNCGL
jgi:hypothetical protein